VSEQKGKTRPFVDKPTSRKNIYMCQKCGHGFVTADVESGVTPFMMPCDHSGCSGKATSFFYAAPQSMLAKIEPAFEWYKPSPVELTLKSAAVQEHVAKGGLISRRLTRS
jgi:hypothetical protein